MTPQHKQARPHEFKLDEQGAVTVAFAQLNVVDHDGDVTRPGAFPAKDVPMSAYGHASWDGALPVGRGSISEAGDWAVFSGQFLMDTDHGRNAYRTVKALGELQDWSYGYLPLRVSYGREGDQSVRYLEALDVFEISPVLVGAGLGTHTLDIKTAHDSPPAGESFAVHEARVLGDVEAIVARAHGLVDLRTKEGRVLSAANTARLSALADALAAGAADLRELLASAEPAKQRAAQIDVLIERLRLAGVTITTE